MAEFKISFSGLWEVNKYWRRQIVIITAGGMLSSFPPGASLSQDQISCTEEFCRSFVREKKIIKVCPFLFSWGRKAWEKPCENENWEDADLAPPAKALSRLNTFELAFSFKAKQEKKIMIFWGSNKPFLSIHPWDCQVCVKQLTVIPNWEIFHRIIEHIELEGT